MGPVTASDLILLIDENNNGNFNDETPIGGALALGNNIYEFSNISNIANNLRFTLGTINVTQTPLPIELVYFDAHLLENGTVKLSWQTTSERNNDFFTVEKSKNGEKWEELAIINGAGNSNQNRNYATIDFSPLKDVSYYRLKQTDFDGVFSFSNVKSINKSSDYNKDINIFPNPAKNEITIYDNKNNLENLSIYNAVGKEVTEQTNIIQINKFQSLINLSQLSKGIYYINTGNHVKKLIKH